MDYYTAGINRLTWTSHKDVQLEGYRCKGNTHGLIPFLDLKNRGKAVEVRIMILFKGEEIW